METPCTKTELRIFLGHGYYRRFIPAFSGIYWELHATTSAKNTLGWKSCMQGAFDDLKSKINSAPVLTFPEFYNCSIVETDASSKAVGANLAQKKDMVMSIQSI